MIVDAVSGQEGLRPCSEAENTLPGIVPTARASRIEPDWFGIWFSSRTQL